MLFNLMDLQVLYQRINVVCNCQLCNGKTNKDVKHYKLSSVGGYPKTECYLNIDDVNGLIEITDLHIPLKYGDLVKG